jgi:signal transduction histidine kinase
MNDSERWSVDVESSSIQILLIEDNPGDAVLIEHRLRSVRDTRFEVTRTDRLGEGLEHLAQHKTDVVLLDLNLPDSAGLETLSSVHSGWPDTAVVVLTGLEDRKLGALSIRQGAQDYLPKANVNADLLSRTITHAVERQRMLLDLKEAEQVRRTLHAKQMVLEQMTELTEMQRQFIDVVTHELRTPMTAIRSAVGLLLDGTLGELHGKQQQFLEMIERNIERLSRFSTDVLSLSRLDSNKYPLHPAEQNLEVLLTTPVELIESNAAEKKIGVRYDADLMAPLQVYADADAVAQVITNFANNVVAHCPEGTTMAITARRRGQHYVEVRVTDDGPGIPQDALAKIFERFFQSGRKSGPGYRGSGIGLSVCKSLVEKMGGGIGVESTLGEGTTFRFTLPTAAAQDEILFGRIAVLMGFLTEEQLADALTVQGGPASFRRRMGEILVERGHLTENQVDEILRSQQDSFARPHTRLVAHNRGEALLGRLAVKRGHLTEEQLNEGLRIQALLREGNMNVSLGQILMEQGFVRLEAIMELLALQGLQIGSCASCGGRFNVEHATGDVGPACPRCSHPLEILQHPEEISVNGETLDGE